MNRAIQDDGGRPASGPASPTLLAPSGLTVVPAVGPLTNRAPAILVLPGGGYARQADHEAEPVAQWLASLGIHAFVLRYKVAPHRHPEPLANAKHAMLWIRGGSHGLAVDPSRVGVLGFSAGGHLAATLTVAVPTGEPSLDVAGAAPDLSVLCYPVISFMDSAHRGSVDNLIGPEGGPELLRRLSAELHVSAATPPAFLWHTAEDEAVPVSHSLAYTAALSRAGVPAELHVFPQGVHGLGLAGGSPGADQWPALCTAWLGRMGWVAGVSPRPA